MSAGNNMVEMRQSERFLEYVEENDSVVLDYKSMASPVETSPAVGGTGVQPGAWPGIVSIQATWENGTWHMCAGVLLSSQWVLTVAHCFARAG
ncbi:hypothetical protein HGM15179_012568 [Zosterops borbonicus]|uniref:Peptidase S1 domain-containing protein n=1 Tax=Zosterops borbonicus TaxID=364589 RepID=A0A8K1G9M1_9PASS|nr:hypothetical protein HGM15179_012568 [Zosterops borbonicus]